MPRCATTCTPCTPSSPLSELAGDPPPEKEIDQAVRTLQEICSDDDTDLARLSVALRVVRSLL